MRRFVLLIGVFILGGFTAKAIYCQEYRYAIDLNKVEDGILPVQLQFTGKLPDTTYFFFPKIVPGIYDDLNYGKHVDNVRAFDDLGKPLKVNRLNENSWQINMPGALSKIEYSVKQGWDKFDFDDLRPYRSSESHFDPSTFLINHNSIFGYFREQEKLPYRIFVTKDSSLYGATSLEKQHISNNQDELFAENYRELVDNPVMYAQPDTAFIALPNISVSVAAFSSTGEKIAPELAKSIAPLIKNQIEYFEGHLATDKYTFIIYHNENSENESYFADGLEHGQSTLILMHTPYDMDILKTNIYGIASHEFFHTILPLGLHSKEIADFDFSEPQLSQHLWLYEGMTEYFTCHMRIKQKIETLADFLKVLEEKVSEMKKYNNNIPITKLSKHIIDMPDEYMNVYYKGTLINLCLDIKLLELSNGQYSVQKLVIDLMDKYGKDNPFADEALFQDIYELTGYPEIKIFIENYIKGAQALPLKKTLSKVGLHYNKNTGAITKMSSLTEKQRLLRKQWIGQ